MNPGYKNLLETLSQTSREAQSGVLHLYTAENHYGRIALAQGEITHVSLHTARGMTALPALLNAAISSHRFEADAALPLMDDLLDTPDILAMLGCNELRQAPASSVAVPPSPPPSAKPSVIASTKAAPRAAISAIELGIIEQELHKELGPMASSLVHECLPHSPTAFMLVETLADQLMPDEGARFLTRVTELLRARATQ